MSLYLNHRNSLILSIGVDLQLATWVICVQKSRSRLPQLMEKPDCWMWKRTKRSPLLNSVQFSLQSTTTFFLSLISYWYRACDILGWLLANSRSQETPHHLRIPLHCVLGEVEDLHFHTSCSSLHNVSINNCGTLCFTPIWPNSTKYMDSAIYVMSLAIFSLLLNVCSFWSWCGWHD